MQQWTPAGSRRTGQAFIGLVGLLAVVLVWDARLGAAPAVSPAAPVGSAAARTPAMVRTQAAARAQAVAAARGLVVPVGDPATPATEAQASQDALGQQVAKGNLTAIDGAIAAEFVSPGYASKAAWLAAAKQFHASYQILEAKNLRSETVALGNNRIAVIVVQVGREREKKTNKDLLYGTLSWTEWQKTASGWKIVYTGTPTLGPPLGRGK